MDCLFCGIVKGEIPSNTIYEDDLVKVFLNITPNTNGHCLIVPKNHIVTVNDLNDDMAKHILSIEKVIYKKLKEKLNIDGMTIVQNNDFGSMIKHYHVHLIPRYENDEFDLISNKDLLLDINDVFNKIND